MMARKIQRIRRAIWTWRQPLAHRPALATSPISDLFVWRNSPKWQTFFELIDIPSLFEDAAPFRHVSIMFFDCRGSRISEHKVDLQPNLRRTLDISTMLGQSPGELGTFAVFQSHTPTEITKFGSSLTERGYVSYRYLGAPLRAYVHGNFEAVALEANGRLQLLGGISFLRRQYSLQHQLQPGVVYELGLVNPTASAQRFTCRLISVLSGKVSFSVVVSVPSGGIKLVDVPVDDSGSVRLVIESRLVMARPLVFRIKNLNLDVFHG